MQYGVSTAQYEGTPQSLPLRRQGDGTLSPLLADLLLDDLDVRARAWRRWRKAARSFILENLATGFAPLPRSERDLPDEIFALFPC